MKQLNPTTMNGNGTIVVEMTIDEYVDIVKCRQATKEKTIKKGLNGIMELFQCSRAKAFQIAHADWFAPAKVQNGKHIVFDADRAWELAQAQANK